MPLYTKTADVHMRLLLTAILLVTISGCATSIRQFEELGENSIVPFLQPGDSVQIDVFREPELSGTFKIQNDGNLRHPLLTQLQLSGLTPEDAEGVVRERLGEKYLINPRVSLRVADSPSRQVLIIGEVRKSGAVAYPLGEPLFLLEAIALAGGFTDKASPNRVRVVRVVDGRSIQIRVHVGDVLSGKESGGNVRLLPGDVITVPEIWF